MTICNVLFCEWGDEMKECIEDKRLKEVIEQLEKVIYMLCDRKEVNVMDVMSKYTNISQEEWNSIKRKN